MHNSETFQLLVADAELANIHIRGQRDYHDLSEEEKVRWGLWVYTWIQETEIAFIAARDGIPGTDWIENYMSGVASLVKSKGGNEVWERGRSALDPEFANAIDERVKNTERDWLSNFIL